MGSNDKYEWFDPKDILPENTFVINDIVLSVPPTQIQINKEDLVYKYKTLRTKSTTKVASGHGQVVVSCSIVFTRSDFLKLHRLIVEARQSPFCYIDNRFIRESIVPTWPMTQNMAMTITGLHVSPMAGASDAWVLQLELIWFNYLPYTQNYIFREDWVTNWLFEDETLETEGASAYTIGWDIDLDTYEKTHRSVVAAKIAGNSFGEDAPRSIDVKANQYLSGSTNYLTKRWSSVVNGYVSNKNKTIYDMEAAHPGIAFDMLPLPDNMAPSFFVLEPRRSRIYVRYMNYLQRDALLKNFGIDVEGDLARSGIDTNKFFGVAYENSLPVTYSLDSDEVPRSLRNSWIGTMDLYNSSIQFLFHAYKEIKLPERITSAQQKALDQAVKNSAAIYGATLNVFVGQGTPELDSRIDDSLGMVVGRVKGSSYRNGTLTSSFGLRNDPHSGEQKHHNGIDIGAPVGTPLIAPQDCHVVRIDVDGDGINQSNGNGLWLRADDGSGTWVMLHMHRLAPGTTAPGDGVVGTRFKQGEYVGAIGNTGKSTGPHLHLEWRPSTTGKPADPYPKLLELFNNYDALGVEAYEQYEQSFDPEGTLGLTSNEDTVVPYDETLDISFKESTLLPGEGITDEDLRDFQQLLDILVADGWSFCDDDISVKNVWKKPIVLTVNNTPGYAQRSGEFFPVGCVLTGVSGSLQHIVANIPILSSEFPTQQHLGSIEPKYAVDFSILDDSTNLEGLSIQGQMLETMRSTLQTNSRNFRPILDGWCVSTDTFVTRLFGSFEENDLLSGDGDPNSRGLPEVTTLKRTVIARAANGTVVGSPGLSSMQFAIEETNPYVEELISNSSPTLEDTEKTREKVLNALWDFEVPFSQEPLYSTAESAITSATPYFNEKNGTAAFQVFESQMFTTGNVRAALRGSSGFYEGGGPAIDDVFIYRAKNGEEFFMVRSVSPASNAKIKEIYQNEWGFVSPGIESRLTGQQLENDPLSTDTIQDYELENDLIVQEILDLGVSEIGEFALIPTSRLPGYEEIFTGNAKDARFSPDSPFQGQTFIDEADVAFSYNGSFAVYKVSNDLLGQVAEDKEFVERFGYPYERVQDAKNTLARIITTARRLLAEPDVGGLPQSVISSELYNLKAARPYMWQSFQSYLKGWVGEQDRGSYSQLITNQNWPVPSNGNENLTKEKILNPGLRRTWQDKLPEAEVNSLKIEGKDSEYGADRFTNMLTGAASGVAYEGLFDLLYYSGINIAYGSFDGNITLDAYTQARQADAIDTLVAAYSLSQFPIDLNISEWAKSFLGEYVGDTIGFLADRGQASPVYASIYTQFYKNLESCGHIGFDTYSDNPTWVNVSVSQPIQGVLDYTPTSGSTLAYPTKSQEEIQKERDVAGRIIKGRFLFEEGSEFATVAYGEYTNHSTSLVRKVGSPFKYPTDQGQERGKLDYIKQLLSRLADEIRHDPYLLEALGLQELAFEEAGRTLKGSACYPDLDLPTHPYYGDEFAVYPDFYMWNIYEDGGGVNAQDQEEMYKAVENVVTRSYNSMRRIANGEEYGDSADQDSLVSLTQITPEGTDIKSDGSGPTSSVFAPSEAAQGSVDTFAKEVDFLSGSLSVSPDALLSPAPKNWLKDGIRLSSTEVGHRAGGLDVSRGAGIHYALRADIGTYDKLEKEFEGITNMFGTQYGTSAVFTQENSEGITKQAEGLNVEMPPEYAHTFDVKGLQKLARDSAKDLMSYKSTLRRAYPTFKLFFVEEDEVENRLLNFDDFNSYNAVKEFTIVQNRKMPADTATIVVQNISGVLDGTRRNTIVDLDYFDKTARDKLKKEGNTDASTSAGDAVTTNTNQDQPFGALVLRPGLNVQLRCGYSNDPDNLQCMLSGRIVDLVWNKTQDLAEITVQSFGVELIQQIKGTFRDQEERVFDTTHAVLGAMMLEPEVVHFGRWEIGRLTFEGEDRDAALDFNNYQRNGSFGNLKRTDAFTSWFVEHPVITAIAGLGLSIVLDRFGGRILGKVLDKIPFSAGLGAAGRYLGYKTVPSKSARKRIRRDFVRKGGSKLESKGRVTGLPGNVAGAATVSPELNFTRGFVRDALRRNNLRYDAISKSVRDELLEDIATSADDKALDLAFEKLFDAAELATFKGMWMSKPWVEGLGSGGFMKVLSNIGFAPVGNVLGKLLSFTPVGLIVASAGAAGLAIDATGAAGGGLWDKVIGEKIEATKRFYQKSKAAFFLDPRDDNLFPPHPKDYMDLRKDPVLTQVLALAGTYGGRLLTIDTDYSSVLDTTRVLTGAKSPISKKVSPGSCQYSPINTTIWQVFHEMSLRHPGWIYGARPYGNEFRYTMFFGTPGQRYWAKGASNTFVKRANDIKSALDSKVGDNRISEREFKELYGQNLFDVYKDAADKQAELELSGLDLLFDPDDIRTRSEAEARAQRILNRSMDTVAVREYLRALEIRFQPFRRYHMFTSDRDIVWNGIMGTENAVSNAVDVQYFVGDDIDDSISVLSGQSYTTGQVRTSLFKAHSNIAPSDLRIAPVSWPNCRTYSMAMRYGMGELLHRMRDMYRGEILLLGNPRIRPWDIGIIMDSYNDMVGPVEVEQTVHMFSHETGYLTEVKPSAVVFANETVSYPLLEAMKLFAFAVKEVEGRYDGTGRTSGAGFLANLDQIPVIGDYLFGAWKYDEELRSYLVEKSETVFGGAFTDREIADNREITNILPNNSGVEVQDGDKYITTTDGLDKVKNTLAGGLALGSTVVGLGGVLVGGAGIKYNADIVKGLGTKNFKSVFVKNPVATIGAIGTIIGAGGVALAGTAAYADFPNLIWCLGGPVMFLQCLRNDAIIVTPLMKNGVPIVSAVNHRDPSSIYKNFGGSIERWVDDTINGTLDLATLYTRYGREAWKLLGDTEVNLGNLTLSNPKIEPTAQNRTGAR